MRPLIAAAALLLIAIALDRIARPPNECPDCKPASQADLLAFGK